ncbi:MAG: helix-turn-helix domain-containing protein [Friedmanniella sp.]
MVVIDHAEAVVHPSTARRGRGAQDPQAGRGAARPRGRDPAGADHRVVLDGLRVPAIAGALGCSPKAVRSRLARFTAEGLDGLGDRSGAGHKPRIRQAQRSQAGSAAPTPPASGG